MSLDILFIHPNASKKIYQGLSNNHSAIEPPIWAAMLANHCKKKNFKVEILDCEVEKLNYISSAKEIAGMAGYNIASNEIKSTIVDEIKKQLPEEWKSRVEDPYREVAYQYFKDHTAIFINNNKQSADAKNVPKAGTKTAELGEIVAIKKVKKEDIFLGQITSNTIKPKVKI